MRIVLVDDDPLVAEALAFVLRDAGHAVWVGVDPPSAMNHLHGEGADVVVTDLRLAGADGAAFIRDLRRQFPDCPIIAISGGSGASLEDAKAAGANLGLRKPFNGRVLLAAIEDLAPAKGE